MYDLVSYITDKGQSGTFFTAPSLSAVTRTIDSDTVWIEFSIDLETPHNPDYIRGWFFSQETLPGYSFFPNSSAIETGLNPPDKKLYTSNIPVRLYLDENTILDPQGNRSLNFVIGTAVAESERNLKNGQWIESIFSDINFTIFVNGNPPEVFVTDLPVDEFESDFGVPVNSFNIDSAVIGKLTVDSAYISGMRVDSGHITNLKYVDYLQTNQLAVNTLVTDLEINGQRIYGAGSADSGNTLDLDYDEPVDRNNNVGLTSLQSIHNFLDVNNTENGNYWALYNDLNAYTDSIDKNNAIFSIDETGAVVAKSIHVNQYVLDSDGIKWAADSNVKIYYDSAVQAWRIEPDLFGYADSISSTADGSTGASNDGQVLLNLSGRDGQFLSYEESAQSYYLDYALKRGRFVFNSDQLNVEKDYIPDTQVESMDSSGKYKYYEQFSRFSHYDQRELDTDPEEDFTFPFNDSDTQALRYDETTNSIYSDFAPRTFAGIISPKKYENYNVNATFNSTAATDFPIFLVVAQLRIRGKEYTISAFRRPKGTLQDYSDYIETGTITVDPPSWGLVYNFGQSDEYYFDFDYVSRGAAPAPVTPTYDGQSTSDWVSAGQTTVFAEKQGNIIRVLTNQFGDTDIENSEFKTGIELDIEEAILSGKTFLQPFLNAETAYGFGTQGQAGVIISDIVFTTDDNDKNIFDLKNDLIYTFISDRDIRDGEVPIAVDSAGYYILDSSVGVDEVMKTGRFFYNDRSKTLYWKDPDNSYQLIKEVDLSGLPQSSAYIEMRGTGLNNNSPAYLYIDNETEYFEFDENPILLKGYHGHGRGLNLTTFNSSGTKLSSTTFDTHGDSANSTLLSNAINSMSNGHIGAITSYDAWIANVNNNLRTTAFDQGLMKLYNAPTTPIRNPYAAVFQKTGTGGTAKAHEISSDDSSSSPYADLNFSITKGTFHTYGPEQPNSLSAWNGQREAWIDKNHNTKINNTLMLTEGRYKGLAFEGTSFTASGINEDSARIYLASEEDSQRSLIIRVGDDLNDKIAFETPNIDGVLQNGFINFHRGNLHIVYDQSPQLGGDLDVQSYRFFADSLDHEIIDLGYNLGKGTNSIATASRQSIFNFLDRNDNETDNFFGIFSNKNPLVDATAKGDAVFSVEEDGTVNMNIETGGSFNFTNPGGTPVTTVGDATGRQNGLTTDDIPEGPSGLNLYFDSARVFLALTSNNTNNNSVYDASGGGIGKITVDQSAKTIDFEGITNTDGLPEGPTNFYFTNERAQDAVGTIMSGDDNISVNYDDGNNAIEITSTLTQETVFGLQSSYALSGGGSASNSGTINLTVDSDGQQRVETISISGSNGINVDGSGTNSIVIDANPLLARYAVSSADVSGGAKLVLTETINSATVDDQVSFLGTNGISVSQASDEITISGVDLQAVSTITGTSVGNSSFITLNDSSPATGITTTTNLAVTASNGLSVSVTNPGASNASLDFSAAPLQITSTLQANASAPGTLPRITFTETDADGNVSSQYIEVFGSGGITVSSIAPAGTHDGRIEISADSMHLPNTTYISDFVAGGNTNEVDFKLLHQGPDSGEDTTLTIKSTDGIEIEVDNNGDMVIGSVVQIEQINNETITLQGQAGTGGVNGIAISGGGQPGTNTGAFTTNTSTSETITISHGATGSGSSHTGSNSGTTVIQNVNYDEWGHVQSLSTAALGTIPSVINDLTDVSTSGIANGETIVYNSSTSSFEPGTAGEVYTAGTGLSLDASNEFTNTAPDQTVVLTGSGATSISGTYPNFTISSTDNNTTYSAGSGIGLSGTTFSVAAGSGLTQETSGLAMSGAYTGNFTLTGAFTATGDITAFGTSDERLKTNVSVIDNALDKINKISGYTFNWNELAEDKDQTLREAGVLAQEVEEVLPEVTTTREDGYKAVRYEKLVPLLIEAIKELSEKVERLEREK